jgi:hypothetical protein
MKKRWLFGSLLAIAVAVGLTGGTIMAQTAGDGDAEEPTKRSFASRLAEKLGLDEASVKEAITEVRNEVQDERVQRRLAQLVLKGRMTQEDADAYLGWYQSRPPNIGPGLPGFGKHRFHRGHGAHFQKRLRQAPNDDTKAS